jgi:hypothetical protein
MRSPHHEKNRFVFSAVRYPLVSSPVSRDFFWRGDYCDGSWRRFNAMTFVIRYVTGFGYRANQCSGKLHSYVRIG